VEAGWSWKDVAECLGITRQAAHARHGRRARRKQQGVVVAGRARAAVQRAREEATRLGARQVGTEHLLLGMTLDGASPVTRALARWGVTHAALVESVGAAGGGGRRSPQGRLPVAPETRAALEQSLREAVSRGDDRLDVEHLLLAILRDPSATGRRMLLAGGRSPRGLEQQLGRVLRDQPSSPDSG
jgi:ATP-dependent Clp protease ATP-binding subunit ClpC